MLNRRKNDKIHNKNVSNEQKQYRKNIILRSIRILCFIFVTMPLVALCDYNLVFIYTGNIIPNCVYVTLKQARFMNENAAVYLLTDHKNYQLLIKNRLEFFNENQIEIIDLSLIPKTSEHKIFQKISPFDKRFKGGFWTHVSERFFFLDDFLQNTQLENVIQVETDVMLYVDIEELLPIFLFNKVKLAGPFQWENECVPSFVYIRDPKIWKKYINHILSELQSYKGKNPDIDLNDMKTLASYKKVCGEDFINLPIVMPEYQVYNNARQVKNAKTTSLDFISSSAGMFSGYLFDAAAFGIYTNGYDTSVYSEGKPGDIHWKSLFDPSKLTFFWGKDKRNRDVPYVEFKNKNYRLVNLHFHSKHPEGFTSFYKNRKAFPSRQ